MEIGVTLFGVSAIQGILLSLLFFIDRRSNSTPIRFIGLIILLFSIELLYYDYFWLTYSEDFDWLSFFSCGFGLIIGLQSTYGPLLLLSIRQKYGKSFYHKELLHFVPYFVTIIFLSPVLLNNQLADTILTYYSEGGFFRYYRALSGILLPVYAILIWTEVNRVSKAFDLDRRNILWLRRISGGFSIYVIGYVVWLYSYFFALEYNMTADLFLSAVMTVAIYTIGFLGYFRPELYARRNYRKYQNSDLDDQASVVILEKLNHLIEEERIHLDINLSLPKAAELLNVSTHYLSQIINKNLGISFTDFINQKRVERAKQLLHDPISSEEKLISIAYSSGFNSKTNFYLAFKKCTGVSPSKYRELKSDYLTAS